MTNRELDKWIAENVMGWRFIRSFLHNEWLYQDETTRMIKIPGEWHPTESISDAFQVVEKMKENSKRWIKFSQLLFRYFDCSFFTLLHNLSELPNKICLAAKKAVEAKE